MKQLSEREEEGEVGSERESERESVRESVYVLYVVDSSMIVP